MNKGVPRPLKKWGQHFCEDNFYLESIVASGRLTPNDRILEIGPGDGRMTELLLASGAQVIGVEIDPRMADLLKVRFNKHPNFRLITKDFLKLSPQEINSIFSNDQKVKVIANLPYYVTTPILTRLMTFKDSFELLVLMVQKEVGERLCAEVGTRKAGAITLYLQYWTTLEIINTVPAAAFRPRPKVDSVILKIQPRDKPAVEVKDEKLFWQMIKASFAQRRKTLVNALGAANVDIFNRSALEMGLKSNGLSEKIRGEKMTLEEFASLCDYLVS